MAFLKEQVGALWQKPADNSKSHPLEPDHPLELDQKCRYTDEPKPKFTDQETRNIDEPDPKFTDQDQDQDQDSTPCKCTHRKPFLCSSGTRFTAQGSFLTKSSSLQIEIYL